MKYIIGTGGFGREALEVYRDWYRATRYGVTKVGFVVDDEYYTTDTINGVPVKRFSELFHGDEVVVAVGDPVQRKEIIKRLPTYIKFFKLIHPSAHIGYDVKIGEGAIITAGCILTCNSVIGKHAHLNLCTTIGHDCKIGDYFTTAPGVNISGNCTIGDGVYFGTNAAIKQGIRIGDGVTIGMGMTVTKPIGYRGVYINKLETVKL